VPEGEALDFGSDRFVELERGGVAAAGGCAFVLVAGGLGERLGYSGIKVCRLSSCASRKSDVARSRDGQSLSGLPGYH
jgi:UDP-sugar pyrophosphorylase